MNSENVKIPVELLTQVVDILQTVYSSYGEIDFTPDFSSYFIAVLWELWRKQHAIELRAAYSKMVNAKTESERHFARIDYLRLKRENNLTD